MDGNGHLGNVIGAVGADDFGQLLALYHLTPFALHAADAGAVAALKEANLVISQLWDADRSLAAGRQHFSDEWITDRGKLLDWVTQANGADDTTLTGPQLDANWTFFDEGTDTTVAVDASAFLPWWLPQHSVQFGNSGAAILEGGEMPEWMRRVHEAIRSVAA